jgi:hypothetical protein
MAVPKSCSFVEKKFQDELNTFPDLPANIQMNDNGPSWNGIKGSAIGIPREAHEAHVRQWNRWTNVTDLYMYYNFYPEIMRRLWRYTNCKETDPFTEVIKQYALRVNNAHNAVINCIRSNQPKVMGQNLTGVTRLGISRNLPEDVDAKIASFITGKKGTTGSQMDQLRQDTGVPMAPRPSGRPTGGRTRKTKRSTKKSRRRHKKTT